MTKVLLDSMKFWNKGMKNLNNVARCKTQFVTSHSIMRYVDGLYNCFTFGKDYSGTKFFYTEPISLNKAHSTKW